MLFWHGRAAAPYYPAIQDPAYLTMNTGHLTKNHGPDELTFIRMIFRTHGPNGLWVWCLIIPGFLLAQGCVML